MTKYERTEGFREAEFVDVDMKRADFREVDLTGSRMRGVLLIDADIDGAIDGLRINGVEVTPLIEAELDRLHPERTKLRPTTPEEAREAWAVVDSIWDDTMRRARALPEADRHRSVDREWSFTETLRHLVFVTDAWLSQAVLGQPAPFHPLSLPASFITNGEEFGIDPAAEPSFDDVVRIRADRMAQVQAFLATTTQDELEQPRPPNTAPGWPPPASRSALECLQVVLNEEWTHHQFAVRDLDIIEYEVKNKN